MNRSKLPMVEVEWEDSHTYDEWRDADYLSDKLSQPNTMGCHSCSFLLEKNKQHIVLAQNHSKSHPDDVNGVIQIPRKAVKSIKYLH